MDASFRGERRGGHGLVALALDLGPALRRELHARVGEDVAGRHRTRLPHRAAHRAASDGDRAGRVFAREPARRAHHAELGRRAVPRDGHGRLGAHDLERLADDGVEHLVEVERGGERLSDRLDGALEEHAAPPVGDVHEEADDAGDGAGLVPPRHAACQHPALAGEARERVRKLLGDNDLTRERLLQVAHEPGLAQKRQDALGALPEGVRALDAREALHRAVPGDHAQTRVGDEQGVLDSLDDAQAELVDAGSTRPLDHRLPSI